MVKRRVLKVLVLIVFSFMNLIHEVNANELTSKTHPRLQLSLKEHPHADKDKDGLLTFSEYQELIKRLGPKKHPNGKPMGPLSTLLPTGEILISDFEQNNFNQMRNQGWSIQGDANIHGPSQSTRVMRRRVGSYSGAQFYSSFKASDKETSILISPEFLIELPFIDLLISGGSNPQAVSVRLLVEGKIVRLATGSNDDALELVSLSVEEFEGKRGHLEIVDASKSIWGHINVDRIAQTQKSKSKKIIKTVPNLETGSAFIQTQAGKKQVEITLKEGKLISDDQELSLDQLLLMTRSSSSMKSEINSSSKTLAGLKLKNGEVWPVEILNLEGEEVTVRSALFGQKKIELKHIASFQFLPDSSSEEEPNTLYRVEGEPIPGKLVWIRQKDIAIDCVLGVLPVPRETVTRFVLAKVDDKSSKSLTKNQAELGLDDGTQLNGSIALEGDKLSLNHEAFGKINLQFDKIQYIRKRSTHCVWLDQIDAQVLKSEGLVLPPPRPEVGAPVLQDLSLPKSKFFKAVRLYPSSSIQYRWNLAEGKTVLKGYIAPVQGSRCDVELKISSAGKELWSKVVQKGSPPEAVEIPLGSATQMTFQVEFKGRVAFPCGIQWFDAHLEVNN